MTEGKRKYSKKGDGVQVPSKHLKPGCSLGDKFPALLNEWDYDKNTVTPFEISSGINSFKVWWKCELNHSWSAVPLSRTSLGSGCPYCNGRLPIIEVNDLPTLVPEIIEIWSNRNSKSPSMFRSQSHENVWLYCSKGHEFQKSVYRIVNNGIECTICMNRKVVVGINDFGSCYPLIAEEWDYENNGKSPNEYSIGSRVKVSWKCLKGHSWVASIKSRINGSNCKECLTIFKASQVKVKSLLKDRKCVICEKSVNRSRNAKACSKECSKSLRDKTVYSKMKTCVKCGEGFQHLSTSRKYCERQHFNSCEVCEKLFPVKPESKARSCSAKCRGALINTVESLSKRQATSLKNWGSLSPLGSEVIKGRIRETNLNRYGSASVLSNPVIQLKSRVTSMSKYGSEWHQTSIEGRVAREETNMSRYDAPYPFASNLIQGKVKATMLERYGVSNPLQVPEILSKVQATNISKYGYPNVLQSPVIKARALETFSNNVNSGVTYHRRVSKLNKYFKGLIQSWFPDALITFESSFSNFAVDLAVTRLGKTVYLDFNPTITHNSLKAFRCLIESCGNDCIKHEPLKRDYHHSRALKAVENNVSFIQWYDWLNEGDLRQLLESKFNKTFSIFGFKYSGSKVLIPLDYHTDEVIIEGKLFTGIIEPVLTVHKSLPVYASGYRVFSGVVKNDDN